MAHQLDLIVALGSSNREEANQRVDEMLDLYDDGVAPRMAVTGAGWAFGASAAAAPTIGRGMFDYAVGQGASEGDIAVLDTSLDTIGDALAIKRYMRTRSAQRLGFVTTSSHVERAGGIIVRVLGPDYKVSAYSSGDFPGRRGQKVYERLGGVLAHAVLSDTEPGDDEAIMGRLFALVPGYTEAGKAAIAMNHLRRLAGLSLVPFEPKLQLYGSE